MYYLLDLDLRQTQYRERRKAPSGAIVLHVSATPTPCTLPDTTASRVAKWIARREDHGSYHTLSDGTDIIPLIPFHLTAFHEGSGGNDHSIGLSVACQTSDWNTHGPWKEAALDNLVEVAAGAIRWLKSNGVTTVPLEFRTKEEYAAGLPGFYRHSTLDPGRRTDPGSAFPTTHFFRRLQLKLEGQPQSPEEFFRAFESEAQRLGLLTLTGGRPSPAAMSALAEMADRAAMLPELAESLAERLKRD